MQRKTPIRPLAHSWRVIESIASRLAETLERRKGAVLAVFSVAYFGLTFYRASRKFFWFDELFTVFGFASAMELLGPARGGFPVFLV
jgi:hypothetical protein